MTPRELFERFGGAWIKVKTPNEVRQATRLRLCGYETAIGRLIMEFGKGRGVPKKGFADDVLLPDLPDDCEMLYDSPEFYDWDDVVFPDRGAHLCCRCGSRYDSKKEHRAKCR